jgi:hypothetical protein
LTCGHYPYHLIIIGRGRLLATGTVAAMSAVVRFPDLLSPAGGLIVLCGHAAATLLLAALVLTRRDA